MNTSLLAAACLAIATTAAAQASPDNSRVPPLASVTGSANAVFTFAPGSSGPARPVLRNGVDTQGAGSEILIWKLAAYVKGDDGVTWFLYTGAADWPWAVVGTADPAGGPIVVPPPPVLVSGSSRLGWTQPGQTVAEAGAGVARLYRDGAAAGVVIAGVVCTAVNGATDCTAPLPALTPGVHTIAIDYTPKGGAAVGRSNVISVTTTVTTTPVGLGLRP